ncbi:MAG: pyrroloquinoline quinone biosynthesis protein PqqB [Hyphomicrobiaceae bacterium]|nr:pyrroloquinoline quinone biosynthesis protein PqqB [Hyphomicrobiaceae bacterium]
MLIRILGSAAGGGFPQWNCNGRMSSRVRRGEAGLRARTQSSLAVTANGRDWVLLNASPDLRQQINETEALWPAADGPLRASPIKAVVVTNADVDHIIGLINLREGQPFALYAAPRVMATINANSVFNVLAADKVPRRNLPTDAAFALTGANDEALGITVKAFNVPGKVALFLEDASGSENYGSKDGDTIGLEITDEASGKAFFYIPGCAEVDATLARRIAGASLLFFDGTLFTDDEMIAQGLSTKTGQRMGHISVSGPAGSITALGELGIGRKIYVHINNSNPMLDENSAERRSVTAAGWEVGHDGMEISL